MCSIEFAWLIGPIKSSQTGKSRPSGPLDMLKRTLKVLEQFSNSIWIQVCLAASRLIWKSTLLLISLTAAMLWAGGSNINIDGADRNMFPCVNRAGMLVVTVYIAQGKIPTQNVVAPTAPDLTNIATCNLWRWSLLLCSILYSFVAELIISKYEDEWKDMLHEHLYIALG